MANKGFGGASHQTNAVFSLEEAPTFGGGSSLLFNKYYRMQYSWSSIYYHRMLKQNAHF
jgi:hypothetical protein